MQLLIILGCIILRSIAPVIFYILGVSFLAFLIYTAVIEIKDGKYGWKQGIATGVYIIITLVIMFI